MIWMIVVLGLLISQTTLALLIFPAPDCQLYTRTEKSIPAVSKYFSDKDSDGIGAIEICNYRGVSQLSILSDIKEVDGVRFYYSDVVFKGEIRDIRAMHDLPFSGRVNPYPSAYMCFAASFCGGYKDSGFALVSNVSLGVFNKLKSCFSDVLSSEKRFSEILEANKRHDLAVSESDMNGFKKVILQDVIRKGKVTYYVAFHSGDAWALPQYELILSYDVKAWGFRFDLGGDCIYIRQFSEVDL